MPSGSRVRLVAGAGARARGADEHVILLLLAIRPWILLRVDPGAVVLDGLAFERPVLENASASRARVEIRVFRAWQGSVYYPPLSHRRARQQWEATQSP